MNKIFYLDSDIFGDSKEWIEKVNYLKNKKKEVLLQKHLDFYGK